MILRWPQKTVLLFVAVAGMVSGWADDDATPKIGFEPEENCAASGELSENGGREMQDGATARIDGTKIASRAQSLMPDALGWLRLPGREDIDHKTWDLYLDYLDSRFVVINHLFDAESVGTMVLFADAKAPVWIDTLKAGKQNPSFSNFDQGGRPDAEEMANGLNLYIADRLGDADGDRVSNIEEILRGIPPRAGPVTGALNGSILYTDNFNDGHADNGKRSCPVGGASPKASIKAAIAAAQSGDVIVIMPGKDVCDKDSRGA